MLSVFTELLFVLLAAVGLMSLGCLLFIRILFPPGSAEEVPLAIIPAAGDAAALDVTVRRLVWLRRWGLCRGRVAVVDCGLNETGRTVARFLCSVWDDLLLCSPADLPRLLP